MGTNAVAIRPNQAVNRFEQREVIDTIKQTVCKGATDAQLKMFLEVCKATGLDPFLKEIWYVAEKGIIMAGRDGYLRVANEHPQFDGIETRVERNEAGVPVKAVCTVWRKDRNHPTICEAFYNEYQKGSPVWKQYPSAMIGKVAEVLALKRSFAINGVVSEEEIGNEVPAPIHGSRQAQQEVLDRKLSEIHARNEAARDTHVEEQQQQTAQPSQLDQILATFKTAATIDSAFVQMKEHFVPIFGEDTYDKVMAEHGLGIGDPRTVGRAKKAFAALWSMYQTEKAKIDALPVEDDGQ